jgi:hypothetical protein
VTGDGSRPGAGLTTYTVTVSDLATVQRVLVLLVGRRHAVTRFAASRGAGGRWHVTLDCPTGAEDPGLLQARLSRPPTVLSVSVSAGG